jgi:hypothetical protein
VLESLLRMFAWMAALGGAMVAGGLAIGVIARAWGAAIVLLSAGALALAVGLWEYRRWKQTLERHRKGPLRMR